MDSTRSQTRWWHREDDKVVCTLCPRQCHIPPGGRGFCFVRANVEGALELSTWGRSSGFCIDPIEKKPLNHFLPGTPVLSFGTAGCNLGCKFCQNWETSRNRDVDATAEEASPEAIVEAAKQTGCRSLAFTYNDPVIWTEYAIEIAKVARQEGLKTVAVTAGYIQPEARAEFYRWMDGANVDLKGFTETFYRKLCQGELEPVLDTLQYLARETDVWFELTNLMIPRENDAADETAAMCDWIVDNLGPDVPVHFTAFHPDFRLLDRPRTPVETLIRAREQALAAGIRYVYVGNVNDRQRQSTFCHGCGKMLIERNWHELGQYHVQGGRCQTCGTAIPGVFDPEGRGDWGRKRIPIQIRQNTNDFVTITSTMAKKSSNRNSGKNSTSVKNKKGAAKVTAKPANKPAAVQAPAAKPRIDFTDVEAAAILSCARTIVDATVLNRSAKATLPPTIGAAPAYGMFVTLRRPGALRSCRGRWGASTGEQSKNSLGAMLGMVSHDAAKLDPRFPAIGPAELPYLSIDVSLMHDPVMVAAKGEKRAEAVQVGKHGLVISHPKGRGLLLPHVPVEAKWNTKQFLEAICRKAGLPTDAWRDDQAQLMTFQARMFTANPPQEELNPQKLGAQKFYELFAAVNQMLGSGKDQTKADPVLDRKYAHELGLYLQTGSGMTAAAIGPDHSLAELAQLSVKSLRDVFAKAKRPTEPVLKMTLLWQPVRLRAADYPQRHRGLANSAILAQNGPRWSLVIPKPTGQPDKIADALGALKISPQQWRTSAAAATRVTAFSVVTLEARSRQEEPPAGAAGSKKNGK